MKSNISSYEQGISLALLPSTIRDAIRVTHMLGFRWLWVDSLCILQDSDEDKLHEIGRMHHIYRYAHLTIIAASARTVSEGFLHERSVPYDSVAVPFLCLPDSATSEPALDGHSGAQSEIGQVYLSGSLHSTRKSYAYNDGLEYMSSRAWCMQEYLMSPRSLIFTSTTFRFRCLTTMQSVDNSFCPDIHDLRVPNTLFLPVPPAAKPSSREWKDMHTAWVEVVGNYSRRTASIESDKLVACAAVAEQFHRVLRSDYLAGLWRSAAFFTDLLWETPRETYPTHRPRHTRPTAYRAPSWSWAAIDGVVGQSGYTPKIEDPRVRTIALAEIVECGVTLEDDELPFGRVIGGTLVLRGTLIPCQCVVRVPGTTYGLCRFTLPSFERLRRWQLGLDYSSCGGEDDAEIESTEAEYQRAVVMLDCDDDDTSGGMWVVPFFWVPGTGAGTMEEVIGMALVLESAPPVNGLGSQSEKTRFRRVGLLSAESPANTGERTFLKNPLWNPLIQAMKGGQWPLVDIEIV
ncbi:hypothetical protein VTO73DRAFT_15296 [Trametes versicolor]